VRNIGTVIAMTFEPESVTLRTSDVRDVLGELHRLQRIESALLRGIEWKIEQAGAARQAGDKAAREWQIEEKINRRNEEREIRAEAYMLTRIADGIEIG
jgi:hypothetical protein